LYEINEAHLRHYGHFMNLLNESNDESKTNQNLTNSFLRISILYRKQGRLCELVTKCMDGTSGMLIS